MKNENKILKYEIQEVRDQLYSYIEKNGINDEPCLMDINNRLDELILQWMKNNGK